MHLDSSGTPSQAEQNKNGATDILSSRSEAFTSSLSTIPTLKEVKRSGWLRVGLKHPESSADHSWGTAALALSLCPDSLDRQKVLEMALVHDWAEACVGDITPYDRVLPQDKARREEEAFRQICHPLPNGSLMAERFAEYQSCCTLESQFVHALDKLEMALQAKFYAAHNSQISFTEFIESARAYIKHKIESPSAQALLSLLPSEAAGK
ncbi:MAG: HD domain-containing protein [Candidatus Bruticola sp.]